MASPPQSCQPRFYFSSNCNQLEHHRSQRGGPCGLGGRGTQKHSPRSRAGCWQATGGHWRAWHTVSPWWQVQALHGSPAGAHSVPSSCSRPSKTHTDGCQAREQLSQTGFHPGQAVKHKPGFPSHHLAPHVSTFGDGHQGPHSHEMPYGSSWTYHPRLATVRVCNGAEKKRLTTVTKRMIDKWRTTCIIYTNKLRRRMHRTYFTPPIFPATFRRVE